VYFGGIWLCWLRVEVYLWKVETVGCGDSVVLWAGR
jgi:hypothetical protein